MSLLFVLREGFSGLRRSRFSGFVATATVAISLILIGIFLIITFNLNRFVDFLRSRVELEVFLDDSFDEIKIQDLTAEIEQMAGVANLTFVLMATHNYELVNNTSKRIVSIKNGRTLN